ncbi:MAG: molybdopterin molybdotransferase MoeA [Paracoccaceae bacterium]|nr:molybdopterin molybdotransferase MoeA [Paracoccaceae bacterium]
MTVIQKIGSSGCGCDDLARLGPLISIDEGLARIARLTKAVPETENVPLAQAVGRVLAKPVRSLGMVPPFDNSAMDGYAINTDDLSGEGPWELSVEGRVAAGHVPSNTLKSGSAVQVFTGAPIPDGTNAVVMQEQVFRTGTHIRLNDVVKRGAHIRRVGEDIVTGKVIVPAGRLLTSRDIAACAAAGHAKVCVTRRVRVALLVTGDEVAQQGEARGIAAIWDVNTPMLSAALAKPDIELCSVQIAGDTRHALRAQLDALSQQVDLIVTTGGISVGEEDHVKPALAGLFAKIAFSGVALKPGKPVSFGHVGRAFWLGLPGNPLSAFVTWQIFGSALCSSLAGQTQRPARRRHVVLQQALHHKPGRCELRLARLAGFDGAGREIVDFAEATHSGRVSLLPEMDGLLFIPADTEELPCGALVEYHPF